VRSWGIYEFLGAASCTFSVVSKVTHLTLKRTFTEFPGYDPYGLPMEPGDGTTWDDLLRYKLVAVLGEAGLGKTTEFKAQAAQIRRQGKAAVFIALSHVTSAETLGLVVADNADQIRRWHESDEQGYFFLDSVDESRLKGTAALALALQLISTQLLGRISREPLCFSRLGYPTGG
jgi:hypothetical protein